MSGSTVQLQPALNARSGKEIANDVRRLVVKMIYDAAEGHLGPSLSIVEILVSLYWRCLGRHDRFILSKGHACPALYAVLALRGIIDKEELSGLRTLGSRLQGHPDMRKTPGVQMSTGSLGQGLSVGAGIALAKRLRGEPGSVFVLCGDGELQEGQNWEAMMFAAKCHLTNLLLIVDRNECQVNGKTAHVMPSLEPLDEKGRAFGWQAVQIDGHDLDRLDSVLSHGCVDRPLMVIANTCKGKGVSFTEGRGEWHKRKITRDEYLAAMAELSCLSASAEEARLCS